MAERSGPIVDTHGREELFDNDEFFDPRTHQTRHNLILVGSHRHSTVDIPIYAAAFRGIDNAMWAKERYCPNSAPRVRRMSVVRAPPRVAIAFLLLRRPLRAVFRFEKSSDIYIFLPPIGGRSRCPRQIIS